MRSPSPDTTARDWVASLEQGDPAAQSALRDLLRARLGASIGRTHGTCDADLEDFAQEACVRVLCSLESFRGDAAFATWATAIAIRVALTALRRRRTAPELVDRIEALASERTCTTARVASCDREELLDALRRAIDERLSPRQRQVVLGELHGIPQIVLAERLGSTPGAIYKVSHDARRKLRGALEERGFDIDSVRAIVASRTTARS